MAAAAGVTRSVIGRIERGRADRVTVAVLDRVAAVLDARVVVRLDWRGEGLDRLVDRVHASLVEQVVAMLLADGWELVTEATFNSFGERGSIDILAFHPESRILLVIEVKSVIPDAGPTLMTLDRKVRIAPRISAERGWRPAATARLLVVADTSTARRRFASLRQTFATAFPVRSRAVRRWLRSPDGPISGLWFLSADTEAGVRTRITRKPASSPSGPPQCRAAGSRRRTAG